MNPERVRAEILARAQSEGISMVRVTSADLPPLHGQRFDQAIAEGRHGEMRWLAEKADRRQSPKAIWPEARSVLVCGLNYGPDSDPRATLGLSDTATISVYARNRDYHDVFKGALKRTGQWLASRYGARVKVFVDTAPVLEKPLAQQAGLGWQGKHTNLVSRSFGSWLFLGEIFTTLDLPPDPPEADHCGSCRRCLEACPTGAIDAPYRLDARRCISYLTIEHGGPIRRDLRALMGNRIYGCDDCLAACPWNRFARVGQEIKLQARDDLRAPKLRELAGLDDPAFRALFSGSPIKRIGRDRFVRNVLIAIGNSGDRGFLDVVATLLDDPASVVRGAAVWALRRLAEPAHAEAERTRRLPGEADATVRAEWTERVE
ncbi:tRNA epoxyqueuosine(34) reductase QueG [Geminicoccus flavidas]|uniref:tRNA epoxyqueuosine(34) reductase QueG n=1 Tax=Geminicoccus flavidas TaxID=2506407 RepID=UPI00210323B1|nr:tRNA epoxyqueuosine(34) reductase QueG [Geminicoccus flavidas]